MYLIYFHLRRIRQDQTQLRKSFESYDPDHYRLFDGEERRYLDPESQKVTNYCTKELKLRHLFDNLCSSKSKLIVIILILQLPEVQKVLDTLITWINDELGKESTRMQV